MWSPLNGSACQFNLGLWCVPKPRTVRQILSLPDTPLVAHYQLQPTRDQHEELYDSLKRLKFPSNLLLMTVIGRASTVTAT